ncbi:acyl-CoA dehydrogenase family protein [Pseudorhizobium flavum]|uniref:Alkylation response protein AidB-like acyl-CoA dehydrogenase n=1 Tax=Pseudorhizobium flavum TaxID=1335061 RepID=A0A7W9Z2G7_9HYPH|nr:acyl-CoA dehydrogenase family protein [Pseudorhizobium flavum]MBB6181936.1 alkylation response protein AidB-like acyl-CoA dehydrogenase [Pseudorhizobium flavum]CAD6628740.1 acyl-CoA dehydrogenase [Pseudorhizobium flavum]
MNFELTTEQKQLQDSAREMSRRDIEPILKHHDPDKPLPKEAMLEIFAFLARMGLLAPRLPEEHGGAGLKMLDYGLIFEQLPPVVAIALLAQDVTISRIFAESSEEQRERLLPSLVDGTRICCTGTTEPDAGSNPREVRTRAVEDADGFVVTGRKMWISNAAICDVINITCIDGVDEKGRGRIRRLVVDSAESAFTTAEIPCLGLRQGHLGEVLFEGCRVPKRNALGASGDAARVLTLTWNANRPLVGLSAVNMAQKAFDAALGYAGTRKQFGKLIGGHQLVQSRLAEIDAQITTSRLLCYAALDAIDQGHRANGSSAMAKRYSTTACERAITEAMQLHGAMGVARETGLEQLYRDVRMLPIPDGANNILELIQGRELTGLDAFR